MDKDVIENLSLIISDSEYFNHYISVLMENNRLRKGGLEETLKEDLENTFKRKELSDYYKSNNMIPLAYRVMAQSSLVLNELMKIRKRLKRKFVINNLINSN